MRILGTNTSRDGGVVIYDGSPLNGWFYEPTEDGRCVVPKPVYNGVVDYKNFPSKEFRLIVHEEDTDNSPKIQKVMDEIKERSFAGTLLEFDHEGRLCAETDYSEGKPFKFVTYFSSGAMESRCEWRPEGEYDESWHGLGRLSYWKRPGISISLAKDGKMNRVRCTTANVPFSIPLVCSSVIGLEGKEIDNEFLCQFIGPENVTWLVLEDTSVSPLGLSCFSGLRRLTTEGNQSLPKTAIAEFLSLHPECQWIDGDGYKARPSF